MEFRRLGMTGSMCVDCPGRASAIHEARILHTRRDNPWLKPQDPLRDWLLLLGSCHGSVPLTCLSLQGRLWSTSLLSPPGRSVSRRCGSQSQASSYTQADWHSSNSRDTPRCQSVHRKAANPFPRPAHSHFSTDKFKLSMWIDAPSKCSRTPKVILNWINRNNFSVQIYNSTDCYEKAEDTQLAKAAGPPAWDLATHPQQLHFI